MLFRGLSLAAVVLGTKLGAKLTVGKSTRSKLIPRIESELSFPLKVEVHGSKALKRVLKFYSPVPSYPQFFPSRGVSPAESQGLLV